MQTVRAITTQRIGIFILALMIVLPVAGATQINSSYALKYYGDGSQLDFRVNQTGHITAAGDLNMTDNRILKFFAQGTGPSAGLCDTGEAVQYVQPNGEYSCVDIDAVATDSDSQNLSEVLAHGNVANQTIRFPDGVSIGDASTSPTDSSAVAIGPNARNWDSGSFDMVAIGQDAVAGWRSVAVGRKANASGPPNADTVAVGNNAWAQTDGGVAIGSGATTSSTQATAVGLSAVASGWQSSAFGRDSRATETGAVAIGSYANATNSWEATFGNLQGDRLDLNVTGNLTMHGVGEADLLNADLDMNNNNILNCNQINGVDCADLGKGSQNLSQVLAHGNVANTSINASTNFQTGSLITADTGSTWTNAFRFSGDSMNDISWGVDAGAGDAMYVFDEDNLQNLFLVKTSGNVKIARGFLNMSQYGIGDIGIGRTNITGDGTIQAGNTLDLSGNQLTNVGGTDCNADQYIGGDGDCKTDASTDPQNLSEVLAHGNTANTSIDIDGNKLVGAPTTDYLINVSLDSTGSEEWNQLVRYYDTTENTIAWGRNAQQQWAFEVWDVDASNTLFGVRDDGDVEVPHGDIEVRRSDSVPVRMEINNTAGSGDADAMLDTESSASGENGIRFHHDGTRHWALLGGSAWGDGGSNLVFYDYGADVEAMRLKDGTQNIEIPNGDLNLSTNSVLWENLDIMGGGTTTQFDIRDGGNDIAFRDTTDADIMRLKEVSNNVEIPNGDLNVSGGSLNMYNNDIVNCNTINGVSCDDLGTGAGSQNLSEVLAHGNVANRSIDMNGNRLQQTQISNGNPLLNFSHTSARADVAKFFRSGHDKVLWTRDTGGTPRAFKIWDYTDSMELFHITDGGEVKIGGAGSAGTPALKLADPDSGLYDCGTDCVAVSTGGTQAVSVDQNQGVAVPNGNLDMNANQITNVAGLNVTNISSGIQIADFAETGVTLHQPLSVESSGAMSVANGIDLTDTSSNTIESYGAFYLKTSTGGSPKDIALAPSGVVGVQSNISMGDNYITGLADPDNPQDAATKNYVDNNAGTDNQNLKEVLVHGNTANRSINMGGTNNVTNTMKVDMGNGMKVEKRGGNIIISD